MGISKADKINYLAQGGYAHLARQAILTVSTPDQFVVDLMTEMNREPVTIASGQNLPAGSILVRPYSTTVAANSENVGNGTLSVQSVGPDVVAATYQAVCISTRPDRGIFELRQPDSGVIGRINVGTPAIFDELAVTVADGSVDFALGDSFSIACIPGAYAGYDFAADEAAYIAGTPIVQVASGVLSLAINTTTPPGAQEQFATLRGPTVLDPRFVILGNSPWLDSNPNQPAPGNPITIEVRKFLQISAMERSIKQLALRAIVLR